MLWVDALENAARLVKPGRLSHVLDVAKSDGFDTIVLGVKDASGLVVYPSRIAPHFSEWSKATRGTTHFREFPPGYDLVAAAIREAHARGMKVYAGFPVFMEGTRLNHIRLGRAFQHPDWQQMSCVGGRVVPVSRFRQFVSVSPCNPQVVRYELSVLRELVATYPLDGLILDYCRYAGPSTDVSPFCRARFEAYLGHKVTNWPADLSRQPQLRDKWLQWRCSSIKAFVRDAVREVRGVRPSTRVGAYFGGWYDRHLSVGTNWASRTYRGPGADPSTALADMLDLLVLGFYTPDLKAAATGVLQARRVVADAKPIYGGVYARQFAGNPEGLARAAELMARATSGLMVFDLSWVEKLGLWEAVGK